MTKKKTDSEQSTTDEQFEQAPMGGTLRGEKQAEKEYPVDRYEAEIALLKVRTLNGTGRGAKIYDGYLVDGQGHRTYICECHQVWKDRKMIVMRGIARDAEGNEIAPLGREQISGFRFLFIEPHEKSYWETSEDFKVQELLLNVTNIKRALKFRKEIFDESDVLGFSLRETAPEIVKLYEGFMGETDSSRPLFELVYEKQF